MLNSDSSPDSSSELNSYVELDTCDHSQCCFDDILRRFEERRTMQDMLYDVENLPSNLIVAVGII